VSGSKSRTGRRAGHPLLELQRSAGNQAVAGLLQRDEAKKKPWFFSALALASPEALYEGKCDADLEHPSVRKKWSRNPLGKERKVAFECGPESFWFRSFRPWFNEGGPWDVETADGGSAWVVPEIIEALGAIWDDDDAGSSFWDGYHTIQAALKKDLAEYCRG
jgi:hypothetical protein